MTLKTKMMLVVQVCFMGKLWGTMLAKGQAVVLPKGPMGFAKGQADAYAKAMSLLQKALQVIFY
ncbi:MAG: hypothetical protein H0A76_12715 [Candidatus Thiodubiliella endoseptemdiera]|uniref:Uncharacterized protein n=1 Tax=Candidatus Thiodubiliella endoseptemdiera TaxID=2738886 RepID=A0A853F3R3_9GAMM|nr:hypothetical protein [Candidatus Thiodubiliella endoseptemdiera]